MKTKYKILLMVLAGFILFEFGWILRTLIHGHTVALLSPAGTIAEQQKSLILFATVLSLFVILPVFALTFFIVWRYRDGNVKAAYRPEWEGSRKLELTWWGIPCAIIFVLATVTWQSSHALDPYQPLESSNKPLTIQVVALQWKWLFIYPEQNIATVNYVAFPKDTPVTFEITSDAPMNSFWIPQLGGQVYAMAGMKTQLHLIADHTGTFDGSSANLSGKGFAGMKFQAVATSQQDFNSWVARVWDEPQQLTANEYAKLVQPTQNNPVMLYSSRDEALFDNIIMKYMGHTTQTGMESTHAQ